MTANGEMTTNDVKLMTKKHLLDLRGQPLSRLVENKLTFGHDQAELHLFETFERASRVELQFDAPVFTSMLSGKKVMHLSGLDPFAYVPGESLLLPAHEAMQIDFPDATPDAPTRCLALAIDPAFIEQTIQHLNEHFPRAETRDTWQFSADSYHLHNDQETELLIKKLIRLFRENSPFKAFFVQNALSELVVRLMQSGVRDVLLRQSKALSGSHRLAFVIEYIRQHLTRPICADELADKACLSKSHFFRLFRSELGQSPTQFILAERIRLAKQILSNPAKSITDACYESGFHSLTHFSSAFRAVEQMSPRQYRQRQR
jgi:AraC-like DNA-binding protein